MEANTVLLRKDLEKVEALLQREQEASQREREAVQREQERVADLAKSLDQVPRRRLPLGLQQAPADGADLLRRHLPA